MALWGVFSDIQQTPLMACESALLQQERLTTLNAYWKKDIRVRI